MRNLVAIILLLCSIGNLKTYAQQTERHYLSGIDSKRTVEWDFYCTEGRKSKEWTKIAVPSNWELKGFGTYNYGHDWKDNNKKLGQEHGLYRHQFEVPKDWKGKAVNIVFDGAMTDTEVKINGKIAGELHQGGFNRFTYDISKLLKYGTLNLLEVDVAKHSSNASVNRAERQADFWIFGGIYRPVFLEVKPVLHMDRVAVDAHADGSFRVLSVLNSKNISGKIRVQLYDLEGKMLDGAFEAPVEKGNVEVVTEGIFGGVSSWNPEDPHLYDMKVSLIKNGNELHSEIKRIGFRTVELRMKDGFYVNGKKVMFKGVNRHSFWPETGRAMSDEHHKLDINLMKEMNMNAVRMSHYCPDERFLDLCDSLGLFVLDELAGWQQGYDTTIGPKRIKELVLKDENHPSVIVWDHGNEGGWDFANEKWFHHYDIQNRPIIYPWLNRNGVDTHHYNAYDFGINRFAYGNDPFVPTEFLHGLYDGGLGAGLYDNWARFKSNPHAAGAFLWVFCDEAVLRTDMTGVVFDSDGNHAPDGILGPHREKEGSFYTVKELWSPVQIEPLVINSQWDGKLFLSNDYIYTNLNTCTFSWEAIRASLPGRSNSKVLVAGEFKGSDIHPGETGSISIDLNQEFKNAEVFSLAAIDKNGMRINSWSWPIQQHKYVVNRLINDQDNEGEKIFTKAMGDLLHVKVKEMEFVFDLKSGVLKEIQKEGRYISLDGGPVPVGLQNNEPGKVSWKKEKDHALLIEGSYARYPKHFFWRIHPNGLLEFEAAPILTSVNDIDYLGISFNYPEEKVVGMQWLGRGPYRVWKNRIHGTSFGVWEKEYNNTITGESFNNLIYPEFKGYHANINWVRFETDETPFTILVETPNIFVQVFTPGIPREITGGAIPPFPDGDISFLYEIPGIGTKFKKAADLGPGGQKGIDRHHRGDDNDPIRLWFDFRTIK